MRNPPISTARNPGHPKVATEPGAVHENVSHVFIPTRERSRVLTDSAYVHGNVIGIYLFRRS